MKTLTKIFAMALTFIMVLSLATAAFAYTITMAPSEDGSGVAGHTYEVYQIYTGTMSVIDGKETLGEVKYGQDYANKTAGDAVPETELTEIAEMSGTEAAEHFKALIDNSPIATLDDDNNHTSIDLPNGYYLIIDKSENLPDTETSSAFILEVLDNVAINSKHTSGPIIEKKIADTNDSLAIDPEAEIQWHDSADHDIGDAIPFKLVMTVPSAFQMFKDNDVAYPFTFHDTEEQGLEFNEITSAYILNGETKIDLAERSYTLTTDVVDSDTHEGNHSFDIYFEDMTAIEDIEVGSVVVIEYTSILTEDAILGNQGNVNEVFGEFRNYNKPTVPAFTPKDTVIAFTYKVVVNKVDENKQPLAGATFTLEKFVASENGTVKYPDNESGAMGEWVAQDVVKTEEGKVFTFKGLDDGYYRLIEDEAPAGYNKIDPVEFTVTADHDIIWENQDREDVLNTLTGDVETGVLTFTPDEEDNAFLSTDVENKKGTILPETGGIGTTIFYVVGALLVAGAVVLLVTKKRMSSAE